MGQIRLSIGQVNITDYLIFTARKTTTPLTIEAQESYAPPQPTTRNVVIPAIGDIDPVIYYVDAYESSDGISFDLLLAQFVYDLKNRIILSERRFYTVGGAGANDPDPDQQILSDPYLDGKTISGVFKSGFRYLRPETETVVEWVPHTGGGIELQGSFFFDRDDVYSVEISYVADQAQSTAGGLYTGVELIDVNTSLSASYRNKRLRCEAASATSLVVTLEALSSVPDGTFYHMTTNGGTHNQTRVIPNGSETIKYNGENYPEMWVGKGEFLRIVKTGTFWEAEMAHPYNLMVGERFSGTWKDHPSTKPEDGRLYDGDEWPRIWWWIKNKLPSTHYIIDDTVVNTGFTPHLDRLGQFVIHSTLKKFRLPNFQNYYERGLTDMNTYGTDASRPYDYPGGTQAGQVGEFDLTLANAPIFRKSGTANTIVGLGEGGGSPDPVAGNTDITYSGVNSDKENIVMNIGVVSLRRF